MIRKSARPFACRRVYTPGRQIPQLGSVLLSKPKLSERDGPTTCTDADGGGSRRGARKKAKPNALKIVILPVAIGLSFVLSTLLSYFLSTISFIIHPAVLINTEPKKNNIE